MVVPVEVPIPPLMFPPDRYRPASASITPFAELVNTDDGIGTLGTPVGMTIGPVVVVEVVAVATDKGLVRLTPARKNRTSSVEASASPVVVPSAEVGIDTGAGTGAGVVVDPDSDPDDAKDALADGSVRMSRIRFMVDMVACKVGLNLSLLLLFCGRQLCLLRRFLDVTRLAVQSD